MINVEKVVYNGWQNCIRITDQIVEMIVTTDVGPRIISYGFCGRKNQLYNVAEDAGKTGGSEFRFYGGHRLWHAPEVTFRTYQPDNAPVRYKIIENGVKLFAATEPKTNLTKAMRIRLIDSQFIVDHRITNNGLFPVELSGWALTMFAAGGLLAIPNNDTDTGLMSNRAVSLWPYSKMNDERVYFGDKFITVSQKSIQEPFKFGSTVDEGYAAYFNDNCLIIKYFENYGGEQYPNYQCNFESYTNDKFLEIESLTPLETLQPDDFIEFTEVFEIYDNISVPQAADEQAIYEVLSQYVDCCCEDCCDDECDCGCDDDGCDDECDCGCECDCEDDCGCGDEEDECDCSCGCGQKF